MDGELAKAKQEKDEIVRTLTESRLKCNQLENDVLNGKTRILFLEKELENLKSQYLSVERDLKHNLESYEDIRSSNVSMIRRMKALENDLKASNDKLVCSEESVQLLKRELNSNQEKIETLEQTIEKYKLQAQRHTTEAESRELQSELREIRELYEDVRMQHASEGAESSELAAMRASYMSLEEYASELQGQLSEVTASRNLIKEELDFRMKELAEIELKYKEILDNDVGKGHHVIIDHVLNEEQVQNPMDEQQYEEHYEYQEHLDQESSYPRQPSFEEYDLNQMQPYDYGRNGEAAHEFDMYQQRDHYNDQEQQQMYSQSSYNQKSDGRTYDENQQLYDQSPNLYHEQQYSENQQIYDQSSNLYHDQQYNENQQIYDQSSNLYHEQQYSENQQLYDQSSNHNHDQQYSENQQLYDQSSNLYHEQQYSENQQVYDGLIYEQYFAGQPSNPLQQSHVVEQYPQAYEQYSLEYGGYEEQHSQAYDEYGQYNPQLVTDQYAQEYDQNAPVYNEDVQYDLQPPVVNQHSEVQNINEENNAVRIPEVGGSYPTSSEVGGGLQCNGDVANQHIVAQIGDGHALEPRASSPLVHPSYVRDGNIREMSQVEKVKELTNLRQSCQVLEEELLKTKEKYAHLEYLIHHIDPAYLNKIKLEIGSSYDIDSQGTINNASVPSHGSAADESQEVEAEAESDFSCQESFIDDRLSHADVEDNSVEPGTASSAVDDRVANEQTTGGAGREEVSDYESLRKAYILLEEYSWWIQSQLTEAIATRDMLTEELDMRMYEKLEVEDRMFAINTLYSNSNKTNVLPRNGMELNKELLEVENKYALQIQLISKEKEELLRQHNEYENDLQTLRGSCASLQQYMSHVVEQLSGITAERNILKQQLEIIHIEEEVKYQKKVEELENVQLELNKLQMDFHALSSEKDYLNQSYQDSQEQIRLLSEDILSYIIEREQYASIVKNMEEKLLKYEVDNNIVNNLQTQYEESQELVIEEMRKERDDSRERIVTLEKELNLALHALSAAAAHRCQAEHEAREALEIYQRDVQFITMQKDNAEKGLKDAVRMYDLCQTELVQLKIEYGLEVKHDHHAKQHLSSKSEEVSQKLIEDLQSKSREYEGVVIRQDDEINVLKKQLEDLRKQLKEDKQEFLDEAAVLRETCSALQLYSAKVEEDLAAITKNRDLIQTQLDLKNSIVLLDACIGSDVFLVDVCVGHSVSVVDVCEGCHISSANASVGTVLCLADQCVGSDITSHTVSIGPDRSLGPDVILTDVAVGMDIVTLKDICVGSDIYFTEVCVGSEVSVADVGVGIHTSVASVGVGSDPTPPQEEVKLVMADKGVGHSCFATMIEVCTGSDVTFVDACVGPDEYLDSNVSASTPLSTSVCETTVDNVLNQDAIVIEIDDVRPRDVQPNEDRKIPSEELTSRGLCEYSSGHSAAIIDEPTVRLQSMMKETSHADSASIAEVFVEEMNANAVDCADACVGSEVLVAHASVGSDVSLKGVDVGVGYSVKLSDASTGYECADANADTPIANAVIVCHTGVGSEVSVQDAYCGSDISFADANDRLNVSVSDTISAPDESHVSTLSKTLDTESHTELERLLINAEQQRADLENRINLAEKKYADMEHQRVIAEQQRSDLEHRIVIAEQKRSELEHHIVSVEQQRADMEHRLVIAEQRHADLEHNSVISEQQRADLNHRLVIMEQQRADLEHRLVIVEQQRTDLDHRILITDQQRADLEHRIVVIEEQRAKIEVDYLELQQSYATLQGHASNLVELLEMSVAKQQQSDETYRMSKEEVNTYWNSLLSAKDAEHLKLVTDLVHNINDLELNISDYNANKHMQSERIQSLECKLQEFTTQLAEQSELTSIKESEFDVTRKELENEILCKNNEIEDLNRNIDKIRAECEDTIKAVRLDLYNSSMTEKASADMERSELLSALTAAEDDAFSLKTELAFCQEDLEAAVKLLDDSKELYSRACDERERAEATIEDIVSYFYRSEHPYKVNFSHSFVPSIGIEASKYSKDTHPNPLLLSPKQSYNPLSNLVHLKDATRTPTLAADSSRVPSSNTKLTSFVSPPHAKGSILYVDIGSADTKVGYWNEVNRSLDLWYVCSCFIHHMMNLTT